MKRTRPLAILNGFGRSLGDGIIGLQAAFAAQQLRAMPRPVLFAHPARSPMTRALQSLAADFVDLEELPENLAGSPPEPVSSEFLSAIGRVIDIRDFAFDPGFRGVAMIDFFLAKLGLQQDAVPVELRRNSWLAPRVRLERPRGLPERYVLFCPRASMAQRDIPLDTQSRLITIILEMQPLPVVSQGTAMADRVIAASDCTNIEQLCGLVAGAALVVSTDTAMVHMADALARPCLSIFTTHAPEWRVRDYPLSTSVKIPVRLVPEGLEFARSEADLMAIGRGWVEGVEMLDATLIRFLSLHCCACSSIR